MLSIAQFEKQKEIVEKLNAVQEYPGSRTSTSSADYGARRKARLTTGQAKRPAGAKSKTPGVV